MFDFLALRHVGILAPRPDIEPTPPSIEDEVLIAGLTEKSPYKVLKFSTAFMLYHATFKYN